MMLVRSQGARSRRFDEKYDFDGWFASDSAGLFAIWDGFGGDRLGDLFEFFATDVLRTFVDCEAHNHALRCVSVAGGESRWPREALDRYSYDRTLARRPYETPPLHFTDKSNDVAATLKYLACVISHTIRHFQLAYRPLGIGATFTVVLARNRTIWVGSSGDCRVYSLRSDKLHQLAADHRWVAEPGFVPEVSGKPSLEFVITKAIGPEASDLDVQQYPLSPPQALLLCTDGFWRHASESLIVGLLTAGTSIADAVQAARVNQASAGANDDLAVLKVQCG